MGEDERPAVGSGRDAGGTVQMAAVDLAEGPRTGISMALMHQKWLGIFLPFGTQAPRGTEHQEEKNDRSHCSVPAG